MSINIGLIKNVDICQDFHSKIFIYGAKCNYSGRNTHLLCV